MTFLRNTDCQIVDKLLDLTPKRLDRREMRAQQVTSLVLQALDRSAAFLSRAQLRAVGEELMRQFTDNGVEVLTDWHRSQAGLQPRGPDGWTIEELFTYERLLLECIGKPIVMAMPKLDAEEEKRLQAELSKPASIIWVSSVVQSENTEPADLTGIADFLDAALRKEP